MTVHGNMTGPRNCANPAIYISCTENLGYKVIGYGRSRTGWFVGSHPAAFQLGPEFAPQFAPEFTPEQLCKKL